MHGPFPIFWRGELTLIPCICPLAQTGRFAFHHTMDWINDIGPLGTEARAQLAALPQAHLPRGITFFAPGSRAQGFPVVLSGRVEVWLTNAAGREILLYAVEPGQSCIQTTLGLMGNEPYTATATTMTDVQAVVIPRPLFLRLMESDAAFRGFVLRVFGQRMTDLTRLLEQVAFSSVEARLAVTLLKLAKDGMVQATQADLAARIGTAREVVSRKLEALAREGWLETGRGTVRILNPAALERLAKS